MVNNVIVFGMTTPSVSNDLFSGYPAFQPVASSLVRKIRDVVAKIFHDFWVTAFSYYFGKVNVQRNNQNLTPEAITACNQLQRTRTLTQTAIIEYGRVLEKDPKIQLVQEGLFGLNPPTNIPDEKRFLAIPFVLKGRFEDHIVAIYFDREKNILEYFDSKGLTIRDRNDSRLNAFIEKVLKKYGNDKTTVIENTEKYQWDCHNCGAYVLSYFRLRKEGLDVKNAFEWQSYNVNSVWRPALIKDIEKLYQANAASAAV